MTIGEYKKESARIAKVADDVMEAVMYAGSDSDAIDRYVSFLKSKGYDEEKIRSGTIE